MAKFIGGDYYPEYSQEKKEINKIMKKYEYTYENFREVNASSEAFADWLTSYGKQGWLLVHLKHFYDGDDLIRTFCYFAREVA